MDGGHPARSPAIYTPVSTIHPSHLHPGLKRMDTAKYHLALGYSASSMLGPAGPSNYWLYMTSDSQQLLSNNTLLTKGKRSCSFSVDARIQAAPGQEEFTEDGETLSSTGQMWRVDLDFSVGERRGGS